MAPLRILQGGPMSVGAGAYGGPAGPRDGAVLRSRSAPWLPRRCSGSPSALGERGDYQLQPPPPRPSSRPGGSWGGGAGVRDSCRLLTCCDQLEPGLWRWTILATSLGQQPGWPTSLSRPRRLRAARGHSAGDWRPPGPSRAVGPPGAFPDATCSQGDSQQGGAVGGQLLGSNGPLTRRSHSRSSWTWSALAS